jgi:B9 domain-containing protein 1
MSDRSEDDLRTSKKKGSKHSKKDSKKKHKKSSHRSSRREDSDNQPAGSDDDRRRGDGGGDDEDPADEARDKETSKQDKKSSSKHSKKKSSRKSKDKSGDGNEEGGGGGGGSGSNSSSSDSDDGGGGSRDGEVAEDADPYSTGISKMAKPFDGFYVMCSGQVESAEFYGVDNLYCKYTFYYGQHWTPVAGVETAVSQISRKGREQSTVVNWNFPLNITFRASSAHGWPRLVLSVYSIDMFGRDVVRGYGSLVVPPFPGQYVRYCRAFRPRAASAVQSMLAWLTANSPEFFDAKFVAGGDGRKNTQVISTGVVKVTLDVSTRGMQDVGFSVLGRHTGGLTAGSLGAGGGGGSAAAVAAAVTVGGGGGGGAGGVL